MSEANRIRDGLIARGLPPHVADGFVMNMRDESGLNPGINEVSPTVPGSRGGFGLYQLTGPRRTSYEQFASQRGVDPSNADAQLDFLVQELQGPERRAAQSIFAAQDAPSAAIAIARDFLRPAPEHLSRRMARYASQTPESGGPMTPMQSQPEQERPRGLRGLLSDPDLLDRLVIGFGGMTLNPNTALMQMAADRISGRREERTSTETRNRTAEWLRTQGRDDLADAVMSGALGGREAATIAYQPGRQPRAPIQVDGRLIDPETFEVLYESPASAPDQTAIRGARTEFTSLPAVRSFAEQTSAFGRVVASADDPSPSGDLALIFNFMKVLDPGSVVREGEFATAQNAGGIDERTRSLYNRLMSGERLTPVQREDFLDRSSRLYRQAEEQYTDISNQYSDFARAAGLPVEQIIPDFRFTGEIPNTEVPSTPTGYSRQDWMDLWRSMTPEQRSAFMEAGQ